MRNILFTVAAAAAFAAGCGSHEQSDSGSVKSQAPRASLPPQFAFLETNLDIITLQEVTNRVGSYTRVGHLSRGDDRLAYEFDLRDGSVVLPIPTRPYEARNRVHTVQFFHSSNDFQLYP
jgi:hypothetical protein